MTIETQYRYQDLPTTYHGLAGVLQPRPIHADAEMEEVRRMIEILAVHHDLNQDQLDYLDALTMFLDAYENAHYPLDQ